MRKKIKVINKEKTLIVAEHTREVFIALIEYFLNRNTIIVIRKNKFISKHLWKQLNSLLNHRKIYLLDSYSTNKIKRLFGIINENILGNVEYLKKNRIKKIILFCDNSFYLQKFGKKIPIILYEHGMINYQNLKEMKIDYTYSIREKIRLKIKRESYPTYGRNEKVYKIFLTQPNKSPLDIKDKVYKLDLKEKWNKLSKNDKNLILEIFSLKKDTIKKLEGEKIILLTQPISEEGYVSEKEKIEIYRRCLEGYESKDIVIKTHPREITDYSNFFKKEIILNEGFPVELLSFIGGNFKKVITLYSTAALTFNNNSKVIWLGTEVDDKLFKIRGKVLKPQ